MRVLVAEHLEDDRFLLRAYSKGTALELTFAEDGPQALAACQPGSFEMAVIDVQLPGMDGLTLVREVRRLEKERGAMPISILALMTNTLPADVARAQEAGFNAVLGKPFSKKMFLSALEPAQQSAPPAAEPPVLIQIQPGMEQMAYNYLAVRRKEIPVFRDLLERADFDGIRRLAHNLKGTGASYGFPDITRLGAATERAAKESDKDEIARQTAALFAYIEAASRQLA